MNRQKNQIGTWIGIFILCGLFTSLFSSCNDARYDYTPPAGMGALIVENYTGDRVLIYIDGIEVESVSSGGQRILDTLPGKHRVALDSKDITRSWAGDVDILEGRRTIMELRGDTYDLYAFDVRLYFD